MFTNRSEPVQLGRADYARGLEIMLIKRYFAVVVLLLALLSSARAITFTFVGSTGVTVSSTRMIGSDGYEFQIPTFFLVGSGSRTATISYTVTADAGYTLTEVTLDPNGSVQSGATATVSAPHNSETANFSQSSGPLAQLGSSVTPLSGVHDTYAVTMTLALANPDPAAISKISVMQVFYAQQAVPEPGTLMAIGAGLAAFVAKRKKRGDK